MPNVFYGWYDDPTQAVNDPSYDPPHDGPCLFCGWALQDGNIRTHSMMATEGYARRPYFYRTHRTCHERADAEARQHADDAIWGMIARNMD